MNRKVLGGIWLIILLAYIYVPQITNYSWILLAFICIISMILMMGEMQGMNLGDNNSCKVFICPECTMKYNDAEWAKKCAVWCKKNPNTCNMEIVQHVIKK